MAGITIDREYAQELLEQCGDKTEEELFDMLGENIIKNTMEKEGLTREQAAKVILERLSDG